MFDSLSLKDPYFIYTAYKLYPGVCGKYCEHLLYKQPIKMK